MFMRNLDSPTGFSDNLFTWILLTVIMLMLIALTLSIIREHDNIHSHVVSERKVLQHEIAELREELKAHDEKPYLFERKE